MPVDVPLTAGFVLLSIRANDVHTLRTELLGMEGVLVVHPLIGPDDLICFVDTTEPERFRVVLDKHVRGLIEAGKIERTETMMILADDGNAYSHDINRRSAAAAWIFCDISVGDPKPVVKELCGIEGVVNAHPVLGRCDIIAYVEADSARDLMKILDDEVRHVRGIRRTDTRLVLMEMNREVPERHRESQPRLGTKSQKKR